jgi:predicted DsbA family dithiol-disulfide isomerase
MTAVPVEVAVAEFTDPMCPWAWGSEPTFRRLRTVLGDTAHWRRVFGILFDDTDDPPPDPVAEAVWYHHHVAEISAHTHAPWPITLERVARTSWPSSLVAKAAFIQGVSVGARVLRRLRETMFIGGIPADTTERALAAARGVPGLDTTRLAVDARSAAVHDAVAADRAETRAPCAEVRELTGDGPHVGRAKPLDDGVRYALPTLVFEGPNGRAVVPGWRPLGEYLDAVARVAPDAPIDDGYPDPVDALERWRSLTGPEWRALTAKGRPSPQGIPVPTAGGQVWLHEDELSTHPCVRPLRPRR